MVEVENGNQVYEGTGPIIDYSETWLLKPGSEWKDYAFESKIKILKGGLYVCVRRKNFEYTENDFYNEMDFYNVFSSSDFSVSLGKQIGGNYEKIGSTGYYLKKDKWYTVRLEVVGQEYRVFIDGELVASYTFDKDSFIEKGPIGYYIGGGDKVQIDDVKVWTLSK